MGLAAKLNIERFNFPEQDEKEEEIKTVLQPDISVICDPAKLDEN